MKWLLVPDEFLHTILNSSSLRRTIATWLSSPTQRHQVPYVADDGSCLLLHQIGADATLALAWSKAEREDKALTNNPLLCVWIDDNDSTIASLPDEERPSAIERLCLLATRIWQEVQFSELWHAKKVADYQTIFLSSTLDNIRVAFAKQKVNGTLHVVIGTVFFAFPPREIDKRSRVAAVIAFAYPSRSPLPNGSEASSTYEFRWNCRSKR